MKTRFKTPMKKAEVVKVLDKLEELYPDAGPELRFTNRFELLIATMLSAQCTDQRVNAVTAELFVKAPSALEMLAIPMEALQAEIRSCGLYKAKAANINGTCKVLLERYNGEVPGTLEALIELPGVGRKTANVVLSNGFGVPAIGVDTHVQRVSNRIGMAMAQSPEKTEQQLMNGIPQQRWSKAHHLLIFHGRRICKARKPECERCPLTEVCRYYSNEIKR